MAIIFPHRAEVLRPKGSFAFEHEDKPIMAVPLDVFSDSERFNWPSTRDLIQWYNWTLPHAGWLERVVSERSRETGSSLEKVRDDIAEYRDAETIDRYRRIILEAGSPLTATMVFVERLRPRDQVGLASSIGYATLTLEASGSPLEQSYKRHFTDKVYLNGGAGPVFDFNHPDANVTDVDLIGKALHVMNEAVGGKLISPYRRPSMDIWSAKADVELNGTLAELGFNEREGIPDDNGHFLGFPIEQTVMRHPNANQLALDLAKRYAKKVQRFQ